jgi:hypothetical protein
MKDGKRLSINVKQLAMPLPHSMLEHKFTTMLIREAATDTKNSRYV